MGETTLVLGAADVCCAGLRLLLSCPGAPRDAAGPQQRMQLDLPPDATPVIASAPTACEWTCTLAAGEQVRCVHQRRRLAQRQSTRLAARRLLWWR